MKKHQVVLQQYLAQRFKDSDALLTIRWEYKKKDEAYMWSSSKWKITTRQQEEQEKRALYEVTHHKPRQECRKRAMCHCCGRCWPFSAKCPKLSKICPSPSPPLSAQGDKNIITQARGSIQDYNCEVSAARQTVVGCGSKKRGIVKVWQDLHPQHQSYTSTTIQQK